MRFQLLIMPMLAVSPERLDFGSGVVPQRVFKQTLTITNTLASPVVFNVKVSAPARLSVSPAECALEAGESVEVLVKLSVAQPSGQRAAKAFKDTISLQSAYFQQKVNVVFALASEGGKSRAADEGALAIGGGRDRVGGDLPSEDARPLSGQPRIVVGGGPAAYRALLQAEFEEKSERVLAVLQAKDASVSKLETSLAGCRADLAASQGREASGAAELEATKVKLAAATTQSDELAAELNALKQYPASPNQAYASASQARPLPPQVPGTAGAAFAAGAAAAEASGAAQMAEQALQIESLVAEVARLQGGLAASKRRENDGLRAQTMDVAQAQGGGQGEGRDAQDRLQRRVDGTREQRERGRRWGLGVAGLWGRRRRFLKPPSLWRPLLSPSGSVGATPRVRVSDARLGAAAEPSCRGAPGEGQFAARQRRAQRAAAGAARGTRRGGREERTGRGAGARETSIGLAGVRRPCLCASFKGLAMSPCVLSYAHLPFGGGRLAARPQRCSPRSRRPGGSWRLRKHRARNWHDGSQSWSNCRRRRGRRCSSQRPSFAQPKASAAAAAAARKPAGVPTGLPVCRRRSCGGWSWRSS